MTVRLTLLLCATAAIGLGLAPLAHGAATFQILSPEAFEPGRLLPPPPVEGGERQKAELAEVRRAYGMDNRERKDLAQWDNDHEDASLFAPTLGYRFDMAGLPATAALLGLVQSETVAASGQAKRYFKRMRPWAEDRTIVPCDAAEASGSLTSYPSGHAAIGYSLAFVLIELIPEKAQAIQERASDYAYSREICGDHYPSDTEASHVLATLVASRLLADPRMAARLEAARAELKAAGLAEK